jgi:aminopeptidase N
MKRLLYISIFVLLACKITANELPEFLSNSEFFEYKSPLNDFYKSEMKKNFNRIQASQIARRPYNVIQYKVYLDWYQLMKNKTSEGTDRYYNAKNTIKLVIDSTGVKKIELDSWFHQITSLLINGKSISSFSQPSNGIFNIPITTEPKVGDTLIAEISYTYKGAQDIGFYLYPEKMFVGFGPTGDSVFVEERLAYLMSEPEMARYWMPCNDRPYDKALIDFTIKLPAEYNTAANGLLVESKKTGDYIEEHWVDRDPMTTYLMHVSASKFSKISYQYEKVTQKGSFIPVDCYVWKKDSSNTLTDYSVYNASNAFKNTVKMMEVFSKRFIEYPFVKYGMDAVQPFNFGGMEHQTMTTVNRVWLRGTSSEAGIAHELGHQWLGDYITCATWKDLWINEGGATWSEAIWAEDIGFGLSSYIYNMLSKRRGYLNGGGKRGAMQLPKIYDMPRDPVDSLFNGAVTYNKSSWIYHMLRMQLGDEKFFSSFRNLLDRYKFNSLESIDFKNSFKTDNPEMAQYLDDFFDQWLNYRGHPQFSSFTKIKGAPGKWEARVNVSQVQDFPEVAQVYKSNIRLIAKDEAGNEETFVVYMDKKQQEFNLTFKNYPSMVVVDSTYILSEFMGSQITGINDDKIESSRINIYPNPVLSGSSATINLSDEFIEEFSVTLIDNLGNEIYSNKFYNQNTVFLNTENISAGAYSLLIKTKEKTLTHRIVIY